MFRTYTRLLKIVLIGCCLVPSINALCTLLNIIREDTEWSPAASAVKIIGLTVVFVLPGAVLWLLLDRYRDVLARNSSEQASFLEKIPDRYVNLAIFGSAALSLFLELVIIRWQSTVFQVFAFYKNFSLLACFLGLGLGYALARRQRIPLIFTIPILVVHIVLFTVMRHALGWRMESIKATPIIEQLNMGLKNASTVPDFVALYVFLGTTFAFTALAFLPVGQLCGRLMERRKKLRAYGWNLLGSVFGVALLMYASFVWSPPVIWFAAAFAGILAFQSFTKGGLLFSVTCALIGAIVLAYPVAFPSHVIHSPYQLLEGASGMDGLLEIRAAGLYHQRILNLAFYNSNRKTKANLKFMADYYELPYKLHPQLGAVAVVGSGAGNDVAAALRMGAQRVDAIEIDPAILALGRAYHPEKPYDDERTRSIVNDAR
ncbi:MAG: hypothetical protein ACYTAN_17705, partial [Planctomycetota bacterium]